MTDPDYRLLLLQFIGSLTLADHMGDVSNDVSDVLERMGVEIEWDEWEDLRSKLGAMGITTLHGTSLKDDDDD
jgi:fibrillarin-like rRNA methylase